MEVKSLVPKSMVEIGGLQIWKNRDFAEWHTPFTEFESLGSCCPDQHCPHDHHWESMSAIDPYAWHLVDVLKEGMRILVLIDYAGKKQVALLTFAKMETAGDPCCMLVKEPSQKCWFFKPWPASLWPHNDKLRLQYPSVHYLTVVQTDEPAFGKYGGIKCYKKELVRLTGLDRKKGDCAVRVLDAPPERSLALRPITISGGFMYKEFVERNPILMLTMTRLSNTKAAIHVAGLILAVTQRGELEKFLEFINGWKPDDKQRFNRALNGAIEWLQHYVPLSPETMQAWWSKWDKAFEMGAVRFPFNGITIRV